MTAWESTKDYLEKGILIFVVMFRPSFDFNFRKRFGHTEVVGSPIPDMNITFQQIDFYPGKIGMTIAFDHMSE